MSKFTTELDEILNGLKVKQTRRQKKDNNTKYRYTFTGKISRTYTSMQARVTGAKGQPKIYKGLAICSREDFTTVSMRCPKFKKLFRAWMDSGWERSLSPSIDRIDGRKGYTLDNIRWLSISDNISRPKQNKKVTNVIKQNIFKLSKTGMYQNDIAAELNISQSAVSQVLRGIYKTKPCDIT